jgi:hypothetical protein
MKKILLIITLLLIVMLITDYETAPTSVKVITGVLVLFHVFKYVNFRKGREDKFIKKAEKFYNLLTKKEKDAMKRLWGVHSFSGNTHSFLQSIKSGKISTEFDSIKNKLKQEIEKMKKEAEHQKTRAQEERERRQKKQEEYQKRRIDKKREEEEKEKERKRQLEEKFGIEVATKIIRGQVWQGMTSEMLKYSKGKPVKQQQQVSQSGEKNKLFYDERKTRQGTMKPTFRVDIDNGIVVGWKELEQN